MSTVNSNTVLQLPDMFTSFQRVTPCHPAVFWLATGNHPIEISAGAVVDIVPGEGN